MRFYGPMREEVKIESYLSLTEILCNTFRYNVRDIVRHNVPMTVGTIDRKWSQKFFAVSKRMCVVYILTHLPQVPQLCVSGSALVLVMAWRLFGAKPLPKPMLTYCQSDPLQQTNFSEIWIETQNFSFTKTQWKECRLGNDGHFVNWEMS